MECILQLQEHGDHLVQWIRMQFKTSKMLEMQAFPMLMFTCFLAEERAQLIK